MLDREVWKGLSKKAKELALGISARKSLIPYKEIINSKGPHKGSKAEMYSRISNYIHNLTITY